MTEFLRELDPPERDRVASMGAQGRLFWLDASLAETSRDDLVAALDPPGHALEGLSATTETRLSRRLHADGASIGFALRCHVKGEAPADGGRSRRAAVGPCVLIADHVLALHEEQASLRAAAASGHGDADTSSTP